MLTSELIKELQEEMDKHGDLVVAVWADHGQSQMVCQGAGGQPIEDREGYVMEIYGDGYI